MRSFFGLGGTKQPDVADLRAGVLSLTCLSSKFSENIGRSYSIVDLD